MERQTPFLKSVLQEADQDKRQELLRMANADQINVISELVMNTIRGTVPRSGARNKANGNDMRVNHLIVPSCKTYKKTFVGLDKC